MKTHSTYTLFAFVILVFSALLLVPEKMEAQRLNHARPSTGRTASRPSSRPAARPSTRPTRPSRPTPKASTRPSRPSGGINGGARKSQDRLKNVDRSKVKKDNLPKTKNGDRNVNIGDRNINTGDKNIGSNNRVNIDKGDKNVNINVDNSKDININRNNYVRNNRNYVRRSPYPYRRPPYTYGGFHFYCHFGYSYHPFQPYYWGPTWHPWGFFVATLTTTAIIVSVNNQKYHYDQGVFYEESDGGYTAVQAPNGAVVNDIPNDAEQIVIEQNVTNNYYYGGTYYEKEDGKYEVVEPTSGSLVTNLPEGAEEVKVGDVTYVQYGETFYQPVSVDGKEMYEVVQIEETEG